MSHRIFAYGTLMPADPEAAEHPGWQRDAVRGRLFDLGPYPALVDLDDPSAGWVEGFVRPVEVNELESRLDPWEGVAEGLYRRVETTTRASCRVWVYVYNRPLPPGARGPFARWEGRRRAPGEVLAADVQPGETH
jgi:indolepyruvate decarboxylase